jgi:DNA-binding MarR family transcriptional regulator
MLEQSGQQGVPFQQLKECLQLTDGNLATHPRALEQEKYIAFSKVSEGHKTRTVYKLTREGEETLKVFSEKLTTLLRKAE